MREYFVFSDWWPRWRPVLKFALPIFLTGSLYSFPRFFELRPEEDIDADSGSGGGGNGGSGGLGLHLEPTELRLNSTYVLLYLNLGSLVVTGLLPFAALAVLNTGICRFGKMGNIFL